MSTDGTPEESKVNESGMVTIPADIRRRLDIKPGDKLRWVTDKEGNLSVEVHKERYGAYDDFEPVPMGGAGYATHDLAGNEGDSSLSEDS